jgi:hypothetical protein
MITRIACEAVTGATVAHFLGINRYAGALIGGMSVLVYEVSSKIYTFCQFQPSIKASALWSLIFNTSPLVSYYALKMKPLQPISGNVSFPKVFLIHSITRSVDAVIAKIQEKRAAQKN